MSKLLLCQAFIIHLVLKSVSRPLQWSQLPAWGPSSAAETRYLLTPQGSRPESKKTNYLRSSSSQWQVGTARKHPSCSLRRVPQSSLLFMASRVPHWHQEPMVPGVTSLTICFSSVYPSSLPWPLPHYFLSQYSLQLRFFMFLSGIYFSGSSDPGKNQRKAGGRGNSDHKSWHPTSGPHPVFQILRYLSF